MKYFVKLSADGAEFLCLSKIPSMFEQQHKLEIIFAAPDGVFLCYFADSTSSVLIVLSLRCWKFLYSQFYWILYTWLKERSIDDVQSNIQARKETLRRFMWLKMWRTPSATWCALETEICCVRDVIRLKFCL